MNKKVLIITSVSSMIDQFTIPNIDLLISMGYQVHVACNFEKGNSITPERVDFLKNKLDSKNITYHQIDFDRNIFMIPMHFKAYKQINNVVKKNDFDFIHCHSPIGGVLGRLIGHNNKLKVAYTAHGFHFYKGSSKINWLLFYPIEKYLSRYTEVLITINQEDYLLAKNNFKANNIFYMPGVGIDLKRFDFNLKSKTNDIRQSLRIPEKSFVLLSIGELNKNKNHEVIIKALASLKNPDIHYIVCGEGILYDYLIKLSRKLGVEKQLHLLGYRSDIVEICNTADVFAFPSLREGLGMAALEGMASGLPLITSNVHGIVDYSVDGKSGFTCNPYDENCFAKSIIKLKNNSKLRSKMSNYNKENVKKYELAEVLPMLEKIYKQVF